MIPFLILLLGCLTCVGQPFQITDRALLGSLTQAAAGGGGGGLLTSLTAVWEMEAADATSQDDATGNGHTFSVIGSTVRRTTHIQGSYSGSGAGSAYWTNNEATFKTTASFSVSTWVNMQNNAPDGNMLLHRWQSGLSWTLWGVGNNLSIRFRNNAGDGNYNATSANAVNDSNWHLAVVTYDGSSKVASISVDAETFVTVTTDGVHSSTDYLQIGETGYYHDETAYWAGRVLSQDDVTELYAAGAGKFYAAW